MTENMKQFAEAVSADSKEYIDALAHADKSEVIRLASKKGIALTDADFETREASDGKGEFSLCEPHYDVNLNARKSVLLVLVKPSVTQTRSTPF